jgi:hypothetical protein
LLSFVLPFADSRKIQKDASRSSVRKKKGIKLESMDERGGKGKKERGK